MIYPTLQEVEEANREQLAEWWRFLPSPGWSHINSSDFDKFLGEETEVMDLICERFTGMGGFNAKISKEVGWEQR